MLIGLTGGIAVGKSTVSEIFRKAGLRIIDADAIAKSYLDGIPKRELLSTLSINEYDVYYGDVLDKKRLGNIIFSNPEKKKALENLIHPLVVEYVNNKIKGLDEIIIYEAALLVETGRYKDMDSLVVVTADEHVRIGRLMARNSLSFQEAELRIKAQLPQEEKVKLANFVIDNSGLLEDTRTKVEKVLVDIRKLYDEGRKVNKAGTKDRRKKPA